MNVGIIGNGNHSKRIQEILIRKKILFTIYKPNNKKYYNKTELAELKKNNIIFIVSPNKTHFNYIKELSKNRYIFCEKTPVSNQTEINKLKKLNNGTIYFNYNFRFSKISEIIKNNYNLGKLIYGNITITHGLALKNDYRSNWRSNKKKCPKGVFEMVSIHWIDFINFHYEIKKIDKPFLLNHSKVGTSYDTSHTKILLKNNGLINIFTSYNAPLSNKILLIFENGVIEQNEENIIIRGPSLNLDKNNHFKKPKLIKKYNLKEENDYKISLTKSVDFFLKQSAKKIKFEKKLFNCSVKSNELLFD
ncbi:hypothetical protein OAB63_02905 [Alphaproteobacteria bacterium]|nr:hypothetical protein [Alphaproteobacteria bacterium]